MWAWTGKSYRNIDAASEIKPVLDGTTHIKVLVKYPDSPEVICISGDQASGIIEYVLHRKVGSTSDALETIFNRVEESKHNGNGNGQHKTRRKRVLRNPAASKLKMSEAAKNRWAKQREALGAVSPA